ncbi:MAG TPA: anti-sigma factor, partial [Phycisphaerales bacterium]|nr:anti-sigma factor [Phycisphaerales bacterium]
AAILFAAVAVFNRPSTPTIDDLLRTAPDLVRAQWGDWDAPEIAGVTGEVVWSDARQAGYMRFTGLPANNPTREQYQLWIVDERGLVDPTGQSARISGGVFDVPADGSPVVIPISPAIKVGKAQLFAITIEKPGGTWVSDMTRRVSIAAVSKS